MLALLSVGGAEILVILGLLVAPLALLGFVFWIWMLVHAIQNKGLTDGERIAWVLVILFLHFIGGLIYFFAGRSKQRLGAAG